MCIGALPHLTSRGGRCTVNASCQQALFEASWELSKFSFGSLRARCWALKSHAAILIGAGKVSCFVHSESVGSSIRYWTAVSLTRGKWSPFKANALNCSSIQTGVVSLACGKKVNHCSFLTFKFY
ncbi:hypothetical protein SRHO_G00030320 [Serrasalmus rhombeus]